MSIYVQICPSNAEALASLINSDTLAVERVLTPLAFDALHRLAA